jgi:hypothetical protein
MKIRLEGSVWPRGYGRVIRGGGVLGRTQLGRPFWTVRCERGLFWGRPCDLLGLCLEHVSVVVVRPRVLRFTTTGR